MNKKRIPLFEIVLFTVVIAIHLRAALSDGYNFPNSWFTRDDAYYYFKVAQNIAEGKGSTFDGINPTNGYHPLWMAVCIPIFALARFDLILPLRILLMVMAVLNALTAILIYRLLRRTASQPTAILASCFWAFSLYIHYHVYEFGLETPLAAFTVMLALYLISKFEAVWRSQGAGLKSIAILSAAALAVLLSRLDLVFFSALLGIWIVFRGKPLRFLLPLDVLLIFVSMTSSFALRTGFGSYYSYTDAVLLSTVIAAIVKLPIFYFAGLYTHPRANPVPKMFGQIALAVTVGEIIILGLMSLLVQFSLVRGFPRTALAVDWGIGILAILGLRLIGRLFASESTLANSQSPMQEFKLNWKTWLAEGAVFYGIYGAALGAYLLWNKIAFGTFTPVSGQIKQWWGSSLNTVYGSVANRWSSFFGFSMQDVNNAWGLAYDFFIWLARFFREYIPGSNTLDERYYLGLRLVLLLAFTILLFNRKRAIRAAAQLGFIPLAAGSGIQILSYTAIGYMGFKEWYWVGQMILITLGAGLIIDLAIRPLYRLKFGQIPVWLASALASLTMAYYLGEAIILKMPHGHSPPDRPYMEVLPFLEENTEPGAVIGMTGGGNVGYFIHDRTIVNMDGLINSYDYFQALKNGEGARYLKERGMDVVFANAGILDLAPYYGQFTPYLEEYTEYGGKKLMRLTGPE